MRPPSRQPYSSATLHLLARGKGHPANHAFQFRPTLMHKLREAPQGARVRVHRVGFHIGERIRVALQVAIGEFERTEQFFVDQPVADGFEFIFKIPTLFSCL